MLVFERKCLEYLHHVIQVVLQIIVPGLIYIDNFSTNSYYKYCYINFK